MKRQVGKTKGSKRVNSARIFDSYSSTVPQIAGDCINYIEKNALKTEGIFRLSGPQVEVQALLEKYQSGKPPTLAAVKDVHSVSGLLKLWLRQLPDAILTWELYECFIAAIGVPMEDARNACLRKALELLPPCNHLIMWRLMLLLNQIHRNSDVNKMSARNLAIVFAPTLFRPKEDSIQTLVMDQEFANKLIETFIRSPQELFGYKYEPKDTTKPPAIGRSESKGQLPPVPPISSSNSKGQLPLPPVVTRTESKEDHKLPPVVTRSESKDDVGKKTPPMRPPRPAQFPSTPEPKQVGSSIPSAVPSISLPSETDPFQQKLKRTTIQLAKNFMQQEVSKPVVAAPPPSSENQNNSSTNPTTPDNRFTVFTPFPAPPTNFQSSDDIQYTPQTLVNMLFDGQIARVNFYLDSLDPEERKTVSNQMNSFMDTNNQA